MTQLLCGTRRCVGADGRAARSVWVILVAMLLAYPLLGFDVYAAQPLIVRLTIGERTIEGMPLAVDGRDTWLLASDGGLFRATPEQIASAEKTTRRFQADSISQLRATLLRELGKDYEVSGTARYVVAHPRGDRSPWAETFENLYRDFVRYFQVRKFHLREPQFPLVGIVCRDYRAFVRFSERQGARPDPGVVGYYSILSNRIVVFDQGGGSSRDSASRDTIVHEATHQACFNTGLLSRYVSNPLWVVEGLATLFEAEGIRQRDARGDTSSRLNRQRLADFRRLVEAGHGPERLQSLIGSDRPFHRDALAAYAESWAFTYYLIEAHPTKYADYLRRISAREPFKEYLAAERLADFTAIFGDNWALLHAQFLRHMKKLP